MRVVILTGESAGQILDLPADLALRLIILGQVARAPETDSSIVTTHHIYDTATLTQPEKRKA